MNNWRICWFNGARGGAVGWGTELQVGRRRVQSPMVLLEFFYWHSHSSRVIGSGVDSASNRNDYQECFRRVNPDNIATFMCRLSWNVGVLNCWNRLGLSRNVKVLLYLYVYLTVFLKSTLFLRLHMIVPRIYMALRSQNQTSCPITPSFIEFDYHHKFYCELFIGLH
jgi:hypothetical protein